MPNILDVSEELVSFNRKVWPKRKGHTKESLIDWRLIQNPYFTEIADGLIIQKDDQVVGQIIPIFSQFISQGKPSDCVWGSDYFVDEKHRYSMTGMHLLKSMLKSYLHFGVGMSDISLKLHKALGEEQVGMRHDQLYLSFGKAKNNYDILTYNDFIDNFDSYFYKQYKNCGLNHFARNAGFYKWTFTKSDKHTINIVSSPRSRDFVLTYNTTKKGIPVCKVVDYSPGLHNQKALLVDMINAGARKSLTPLIFYSGAIDISRDTRALKHKTYPILSNLKKKGIEYDQLASLHVTGIDSDRLINDFL